MEQIYRDYAAQGLMVLSIGTNQNQTTCATWRAQYGITHPVLSDPNGSVYGLFGNGYVPYNTIIDSYDILRYTASGFNESVVRSTITANLPDVFLIIHEELNDTEDTMNPYPIEADIVQPSNITGSPVIYYSTTGAAPFDQVPMTMVNRDMYTGSIPAQESGTTMSYYLHAANDEGRSVVRPFTAPAALYSFYIGPDSIYPVIVHTPIPYYATVLWPLELEAVVTDNIGIDSVEIEYRINGGSLSTVSMGSVSGDLYSGSISDPVNPGDLLEYRIIATDSSSNQNQTFCPIAGYHEVDLVERISVYLLDLDTNNSSAPAIEGILQDIGVTAVYGTSPDLNMAGFESVFVFLGVYSSNHQLTTQEGTLLADFLAAGGRIYMEGGDTWFFDPETPVHPYFHITGTSDGNGDIGPVNGVAGTWTEGMSFSYNGENDWMDHLSPQTGAVTILRNGNPVYDNAIAYTDGSYKTIGASFELAGLVNGGGISNKQELVSRYLVYFGILEPTVTPTPTDTPVYTPTPTPTDSPVPTDTPVPPTITATPAETPVPTPTVVVGGPYIDLILNQTTFYPNDPFLLQTHITNGDTAIDADEYIILDVYAIYFFWPGWTEDLDLRTISIPAQSSNFVDILEFTWPEGAGEAGGLKFWAALLVPGTTDLYDYTYIEFGYGMN
ncbi:hypothetical protein JW905_16200 [bacterium]|nr:hypothetical protein [candidate division CSSED10-310 bacterium]